MKEKVYEKFIEKTGGITTNHSLEEDIRLTADLDENFKDMVYELGVAELAMYTAFRNREQVRTGKNLYQGATP